MVVLCFFYSCIMYHHIINLNVDQALQHLYPKLAIQSYYKRFRTLQESILHFLPSLHLFLFFDLFIQLLGTVAQIEIIDKSGIENHLQGQTRKRILMVLILECLVHVQRSFLRIHFLS